MGFFDFLNSNDKPSIDLKKFRFTSDNHIRYENGVEQKRDNKGANRGIEVISDDNKVFTATMHNLDGNHPLWGNNIQMAPKRMKLLSEDESTIKLRGFGVDAMGSSFADYGLTLHKEKNKETFDKVTLHMFDRNIDIVYLKKNEVKQEEVKQDSIVDGLKSDMDVFEQFYKKWNSNAFSMQEKMMIAMKTDGINNEGVAIYRQGDYHNAAKLFMQALEIMPINDDALKNLKACYLKYGDRINAMQIDIKLAKLENQ